MYHFRNSLPFCSVISHLIFILLSYLGLQFIFTPSSIPITPQKCKYLWACINMTLPFVKILAFFFPQWLSKTVLDKANNAAAKFFDVVLFSMCSDKGWTNFSKWGISRIVLCSYLAQHMLQQPLLAESSICCLVYQGNVQLL